MAIDMHGIFQAYNNQGQWDDIETHLVPLPDSWLYHWLVGLDSDTNIVQLSTPRGLPHDFIVNDNGRHPIEANPLRGYSADRFSNVDTDVNDPSCLLMVMGQHSHSWALDDEILTAPDQFVRCHGIIPLKVYQTWDGSSLVRFQLTIPYKATVSEPDQINGSTTHVKVFRDKSLKESISYFIAEVQRLKEIYGKVRFVFGFSGSSNVS